MAVRMSLWGLAGTGAVPWRALRVPVRLELGGLGPIIPAKISCSVGALAGRGDGRMRPPEVTLDPSRFWNI